MRTLPLNKTLTYLSSSLLITSLLISTTVIAMPMQGGLSGTSKSVKETVTITKTESGALTKNPVIARNTTAKTEAVLTTPAAQKDQDKKTISRCWKRLMNMVREVSHAHRTRSNS